MTMRNREGLVFGRDSMEQVGEELLEAEEGTVLSEKGQKILENTDFIWAMALDGEGRAVWEWRLPDEVPRKFTLQDVAVFSRWYLEDYPVRTWKSGELLLVFGCDKEKITRYDMLMSLDTFRFLLVYLKVMAIANILIILLFIFSLISCTNSLSSDNLTIISTYPFRILIIRCQIDPQYFIKMFFMIWNISTKLNDYIREYF